MKGIAYTTNNKLKKHPPRFSNILVMETIGTICAASGFFLLSEGFYLVGFIVGIVSCLWLLPVLWKNKLIPLFCLQLFFFSVNINGILNNWIMP